MSKSGNPDYNVLLPEWQGGEPWFELSSQEQKTVLGGSPHRVALADKKQCVHQRASTCDSLLAIYPNAISIGGVLGAASERGDVGFGGWMTLGISLATLWMNVDSILSKEFYSLILFFPAFILFFLGSVKLIKTAYFLPKDNPVIFNRVTREVMISKIVPPSFFRFWEFRGSDEPIVVSWNSIHVRSYKFSQYMGSSFRHSYRLEIWAPKQDDSRKLLIKQSLGYLGWYEDEKLWRLYEHIRRYMEEGGPAIQHGEVLRKLRKGGELHAIPESVGINLGGPALTEEEVKQLAK